LLTIRKAQMDALAKGSIRTFERQLVGRLRGGRVAEGLMPEELRSRVKAGLEAALKYGFVGRSQVERFVEVSVRCGPDFHQAGWAKKILWDPGLKTAEKLNLIEVASRLAKTCTGA
jgi:hypothetical protein